MLHVKQSLFKIKMNVNLICLIVPYTANIILQYLAINIEMYFNEKTEKQIEVFFSKHYISCRHIM